MVILDGNKLAKEILANIAKEIRGKHLHLKLAVVSVGNNLASGLYIGKKKEACAQAGIDLKLSNFPSDIDKVILAKEIKKIIEDKSVSGLVIQLPLPPKFDASEFLNLIPARKDVDVLSSASFDKFSENNLSILPPVVEAISRLLEKYNISLKNKKIFLLGNGRLVGRPLSVWLKNKKIDFSFADKNTPNIPGIVKNSDIIISGTGCPGIIKKEMVKDGVILIDVGTSSENGKIKGDIEPSAYQKASYVAPVPGGVGPLTVACLVYNLVKLNKKCILITKQ